jgi:hypothetical protein
MQAANKAPQGGLVSPVNGQFYAGGEFMPITGEYCGKGRNKVTAARFSEVAALAAGKGWELFFNEAANLFQLRKNGNAYFSGANLNTLAKLCA